MKMKMNKRSKLPILHIFLLLILFVLINLIAIVLLMYAFGYPPSKIIGWPNDKPTSNTTTTMPVITTTIRHMTTTSSLCKTLEECDTGKPHSVCNPTELGCLSPDGKLITMGCYNQNEFTCFPGGNLCRRPLLACFDIENPQSGAKCEDIDKYASNIAKSDNFIGSSTNNCDIRAKEIF